MWRRPKFLLTVAVLGLGLFLVLLPSRLNSQLKRTVSWLYLPLVSAADGVEHLGHRSRAFITPRALLLAEIDRIRQENFALRIREFQTAAVFRQNRLLREKLDWAALQPWALRLSRIIIEEPANWWRSVTLNVGSDVGVRVNDPVVTEKGLVGKVVSVTGSRAQVALLGDANCRVAAVLGSSGHAGIVTPSPEGAASRRIVELKHLPSDADLEPGVEVLTSGSGGVFPSGIPIGRIIDSQSYDYGLYSGARIRLGVNLDRLDFVWVITGQTLESAEGPQ